MYDLAQIKVLQEVTDRGSFSAAADALDYTQSAVSKQIAAGLADRVAPDLIISDLRLSDGRTGTEAIEVRPATD